MTNITGNAIAENISATNALPIIGLISILLFIMRALQSVRDTLGFPFQTPTSMNGIRSLNSCVLSVRHVLSVPK